MTLHEAGYPVMQRLGGLWDDAVNLIVEAVENGRLKALVVFDSPHWMNNNRIDLIAAGQSTVATNDLLAWLDEFQARGVPMQAAHAAGPTAAEMLAKGEAVFISLDEVLRRICLLTPACSREQAATLLYRTQISDGAWLTRDVLNGVKSASERDVSIGIECLIKAATGKGTMATLFIGYPESECSRVGFYHDVIERHVLEKLKIDISDIALAQASPVRAERDYSCGADKVARQAQVLIDGIEGTVRRITDAASLAPGPAIPSLNEPRADASKALVSPPETEVRPLPMQQQQEQEVLRVIRELGYDPQALPKRETGRRWIKAQVKEHLPAFSHSVLNKVWERLRADGRVKESES
jgi:hypothetical protein